MAIEDMGPGSPGRLFKRLGLELASRQPRYDLLDRYATGDHPLPEGHDRCRDAYRKFQRKARNNYTGLAVEAVAERLRLAGFRTGASGSEVSDSDAWNIWQANWLDADSKLIHRAALTFGESYVIVGPPQPGSSYPTITPEDPRQVIVEYDPLHRRTARAALKMWHDDAENVSMAFLYLPDVILTAVSERHDRQSTFNPNVWDWVGEPVANPIGIVPIVRFAGRPSLDGTSLGEFEDVIDVQDRMNNSVLDRLVIAKMQAYRQRWVKGLVTEDEDGNKLPFPFKPGSDLVWTVEDEDVQFGEFGQADMTPIMASIRDDIKDFAALTRTPPHYLMGEIVNASGGALKQAETGLISKVAERQVHYGESWEQVMFLAFTYLGDEARANTVDMEVIWADTESRSLAELSDAVLKQQQVGVPFRTLAAMLGYSPQAIDRMVSEQAEQQLFDTPVNETEGA